MSNIPLANLRLVGRNTDFLDRKIGQRGEIFYDQQKHELRLFDGDVTGGVSIARSDQTVALDLSNIDDQVFKDKATQAGIVGGASIDTEPPAEPQFGQLWFDTDNGILYVYYNDGTSDQWVQPATIQYGGGIGGAGGSVALDNLTDVTVSSPTSGQVLKYNGTAWVNGTDNAGAGGSSSLIDLTDVSVSNPSTGQVLKYNGTAWVNGADDAGSSGVTEFGLLDEVSTSSLSFDKIYLPAITMLTVSSQGSTAYLFDQYSGNNPTIYAITGTTIAFNLTAAGHPFQIQDPAGTNYNTGLIHVSADGVVSTGVNAQGKTSGTLYWKIPSTSSGNYRYQCASHVAMVGSIVVKNFVSV
jgi:plastocyanin